ncbi:MAG: hypothetical protein KAT58_02270 [candidate division Zixibacteria bacterium]|nr:hypothetical protein [candidate division Zixibacteria bacterium]
MNQASTTSGKHFLQVALVLICLLVAMPVGLAMQISHTVQFSQDDLLFEKRMDYDVVKLQGAGYLAVAGEPMLPAVELRIALPAGMKAENIRIDGLQSEALAGKYNIFPAQPPLKFSQAGEEIEFVAPKVEIYQSSATYPAAAAKITGQTDLAGQGIAIIQVCPLSYVPAEGTLTLFSSMTLVIEGGDDYVCGDYLPENLAPHYIDLYQRQLADLVVNSDDIALTTSPFPSTRKVMLPPGGPFDHVIITTSSLATHYADLVAWHTRKGVKDTVITTDYIYANYTGSDNQQKIRNFVIDAHNNWGTLYFLMGGEDSQVPFKYRTYVSESIPSDQYYADYDDDWTYEVYVGRVTAANATEINRFVDKVLKYELDPPVMGYVLDAVLLGMDLTLAWEPPYYTLTASEELKEYIDTSYIPSRFNVTKVYDSDHSDHRIDFLNALNAGQNLVNHSDHSSTTSMGTGDRNHDSHIYNSTVDGLTNTGKMSVVFSLGCHCLEWDYSDCIGEHFVIYNDLKAGVAYTGNTRSGWFYVGDPISLSAVLDANWFKGLFDHDMYRLGEALAYTKNNTQHSDNYWRYCHWTLNLLGEPEMPIWTDSPVALEATHPDSVTSSPFQFTVNAHRTHGTPVDSAFVCLYKAGDIYERGLTDANGDISFMLTPFSSGDLLVTVTKQNFLPYQGQAGVDATNTAPTCQVPDDSTIQVRGGVQICLPVGCDDPDGNLASGPTIVAGPGEISEGNWCYTPSGDDTATVTIRCEDTGGLFCEATFQIIVDTYMCGDADGSSLVNIADVVFLISYVFGGTAAPEPLEAGEVDCDGVVNIADVVYLINYIFGSGPAPCEGC